MRIVPSAFVVATLAATLLLLLLAPACESGCAIDGDCAAGSYCSLDGACVTIPTPRPPDTQDGWDDVPGTGPVFVMNALHIAPRDHGFDVDGRCIQPRDCIDNKFSALAPVFDDQLRQSLLGGTRLVLMEVAGLDPDYAGDDPMVTIKLYDGLDADDPFFPANNFRVPPGHTTCCEFLIDAESLVGSPPRARSRIRARIAGGRIVTTEPSVVSIPMFGFDGSISRFLIESARFAAVLPSDLQRIEEVVLGGALTVRWLASISYPYCFVVSPRCAERYVGAPMLLVVKDRTGQPDIDLDGDGLECVVDSLGDGNLDVCCDGGDYFSCGPGPACTQIPAIGDESCAQNARFADAYSIAFDLTGVAARVVGIGTRTSTSS